MKKIEAYIRPFKLEAVRQELLNVGINRMTVFDVKGVGEQQGHNEIYRGQEYQVDFVSKIKIELFVHDDQVESCFKVLAETGRTGQIGDGIIVMSQIERLMQIRTEEVMGATD